MPLVVIGSSLVADGLAQHKATAKRTSPTVLTMRSEVQGTLSVSFVNAPDGAPLNGGLPGQRSLDLGTASYQGGSLRPGVTVRRLPASFVVSTTFGLTLQDASQHVAGAIVLAALAAPDVLFSFRLDGLKLGTAPQMLQGQAKIGVTTRHLLEIEVPTSLTEKNSQLQNAIIFQVIAN